MDKNLIPILAVVLLTLRAGYKSNKTKTKFLEMFNDKKWVLDFVVVLGFIMFIVYTTKTNNDHEETMKLQDALKKAIVAFAIAILAELGLTITPFWLVFVLVYYMEGWI